MRGWFEASGLDPVLNNGTHCGRKRFFTRRAAETAAKRSRNSPHRVYHYLCDQKEIYEHYHLTSRKQP